MSKIEIGSTVKFQPSPADDITGLSSELQHALLQDVGKVIDADFGKVIVEYDIPNMEEPDRTVVTLQSCFIEVE